MKKTIQFLVVTATLTLGVAKATLVSHFTFDETSGTTAADSVAGGTPGTIGTNVTLGAAGKFGTSFTFNNDATQNGIVEMGNATAFAALTASQKVTVSVWLKWTTPGGRDCAVFLGNDTGAARYIDVGTTSAGAVYGRSRDAATTGGAFADIALGTGLNDGQWHHVAYTSNAATDVTQLYIDGVLVGSTSSPAFTFPAFNNFEIGRLGRSSPTDAYAGSVDELRIYDTILSASDIAGLAGIVTNDPILQVEDTSSFINKGKPQVLSIPFSNLGTAQTLSLSGPTPIAIGGNNPENFTVASYDNSLAPGASGTILLNFTPASSGFHYATLTIASNDALHPMKEVYVTVEVRDPVALAAPTSLDFGSFTTVSQPQTRTLTITNDGEKTDLQVYDGVVSGSLAFSITNQLPLTIAPGQQANITVTFDPAGAEGGFQGSLSIFTDGYVGGSLSIPLSASVKLGDPNAALVSHFTFDDSASPGNDSGSYHNHGTPVGDARNTSSARIGSGALLLDGAGDLIDLGTASGPSYTSQLVDDGDGFTVACWAAVPTTTVSDRVRFFSSYTTGTTAEGWGVGRRNGSRVLAATTYGKVDYLTPANSAPVAGAWHHYAYVFRQVPVNRIDFYVDGVLAGSQTSNNSGFNDASTIGFAIGALGRTASFEGFDGRLDDLRIYDRELQAANVSDLYTSAPPESGYGVWAAGFGLNPTGDGARLADPDGDGFANSVEYLLGSNPVSGLSSHRPVVTRGGGNLVVIHRRKTAAVAEGWVDQVEYSDLLNAGGWVTAVNGVGGVTVGTVAIDAETEEVTTTIPSPGDKRFARVKVIAP
ncbi:choice-of-anchor D domain-containing protein [Luteolibacter yonseiensis]|uniref:Choice-of-anchor D domain-containing protein n=1 Tax=Luteolibacter yonseiensis TaxID=1144680 RepID=A0A934R945_9BACT|nr:LamG-like jellyroll fold domain-containing protein [Luteolibacter yonseiensis]MBK1818476.1 choice-of-anchor D domain-containing protein [Luteolibacter yonseiensis]